jgi:hypothetical protein
MTMMEQTPSQVLLELKQRFEEPGGHGAILEPGNGGGGGGGGGGDNGEVYIDPEEARGGLPMPVIIGAVMLGSLALRLAPYVLRVGAAVSIPVRFYNRIPPHLRNALQAAAVGATDASEEQIDATINSILGGGDDNASVYEITGSDDELARLTQGNGGMGLTLVPGLGNLPPGVWIVKQWRAPRDGGVQFYKFSNGLIAVQKLDGTWKVYRPRKPIVLYAGVGNNRRSIMRAAHIVRAEVKAWKSMEKFFGMQRRRALPAPKRGRAVVIEHGSGSVVTD